MSRRSTAGWTPALAAEFTESLDPSIGRLVPGVCGRGTPREKLRRWLEPFPEEVRSLLMWSSHALGRFMSDRGRALPRPVYPEDHMKRSVIDSGTAPVAWAGHFDAGGLSRGGRDHDTNDG